MREEPNVRLRRGLAANESSTVYEALCAGADPVQRDPDGGFTVGGHGRTVLHHAASYGLARAVRALLAAGHPVDLPDAEGRTPLFFGATHPEVVRLLLDAGADPRHRDRYGSSVLFVFRTDDEAHEGVRRLIEAGADPNVENEHGATALVEAIHDYGAELVRVLLAGGADPNHVPRWRGGAATLHVAAHGGHLEIVRHLLDAGADVHLRDEEGRTPADVARIAGHHEVVRLLAAHGGDPGAEERRLPEGAPDPKRATLDALLAGWQVTELDPETVRALAEGSPADRALAHAIETGDLEPYFEALREVFGRFALGEGFEAYARHTLRIGELRAGAFTLVGVARAHRTLGTWADLWGPLPVFGDAPFPGFRIGRDDRGHVFWLVAARTWWGKRNGWVLGLPEAEYRLRGQRAARDAELHTLGDYDARHEYAELVVHRSTALDVLDLVFLGAALVDPRFAATGGRRSGRRSPGTRARSPSSGGAATSASSSRT